MTTLPGKADIRDLLRDVTRLGAALTSSCDDQLDEADLGLDSITMIWVVTQLRRRTGLADVSRVTALDLRSVNSIHKFLGRCRQNTS